MSKLETDTMVQLIRLRESMQKEIKIIDEILEAWAVHWTQKVIKERDQLSKNEEKSPPTTS